MYCKASGLTSRGKNGFARGLHVVSGEGYPEYLVRGAIARHVCPFLVQ